MICTRRAAPAMAPTILLLTWAVPAWAQAETEPDDPELEALRAAADEEIGAGTSAEGEEPETGIFESGARALQALNPEISATGDFVGSAYLNRDGYVVVDADAEHEHADSGVERGGFAFRAFELALQSNLDPYSMAKFIFALHGGTPELGEGYVSWTGLLPRVTLTVGRFRQQFGVINRWHEHAFDQIDRPYVHSKLMGDHGLVGTGLSAKVLIPRAWAHAQKLTVEVANGENPHLFAGELFSIPTVLGHLESYWDLNRSTYFQLGLSGIWGVNNRRGFLDEELGWVTDEPWRHTVLAGADLTLSWVPVGRAKYRGAVWRSELLYLRKQEDHEGDLDTGDALGGFTYLDIRIGPRTLVGARFDVGQNLESHGGGWFWQASPYLSFWQSEFVYLRLQYNATWESRADDPIHAVMLQGDWSIGPHKHEKY